MISLKLFYCLSCLSWGYEPLRAEISQFVSSLYIETRCRKVRKEQTQISQFVFSTLEYIFNVYDMNLKEQS